MDKLHSFGGSKRVGLVHVPYRFIGGEDLYVSALNHAYRAIGIEPVEIPRPSRNHLLLDATKSLTVGNEAEWDSIVREHSIDFLHLNNIHAALGPAFLRWIARRKIPTVMTVHNHRFYCTNGLALYGSEVCKTCRLRPSLLRPILRNCNASVPKTLYHSMALKEIRSGDLFRKAVQIFLAPSPYIARELQISGFSPKSIRIFPHAVDVEGVSTGLKVPHADVVFVGRLSKEKGINYLIQAARCLPQFTFAVVGEGPLEAEVRQEIVNMPNVRFFGQMKREDALAVMKSARVACVPSVCQESFSLVAAEALSFGLRLVVPDTQSFLHYAEKPVSAITAIVTNPESLAYSICTALEQPTRPPEETAAIRARYSMQGFLTRLAEVAGEITSAGSVSEATSP